MQFRYWLGLAFMLTACEPVVAASVFECPDGRGRLSMTVNGPPTVPAGVRLLNDAQTLEAFLTQLEGHPPNWPELLGPHDGHDYDRLFAENRQRDRARGINSLLNERIAFFWYGILSTYRSEESGFSVAIGPKLIPTRWGIVRFKMELVPCGMIAVPSANVRTFLHKRASRNDPIEVDVLFIGRLMPGESIIYDMSHENTGEGVIMPVVRVERVEYLLNRAGA